MFTMDEHPYSEYQFTLSSNGDGTLNLEKTPIDEGMRPWGHRDLEF